MPPPAPRPRPRALGLGFGDIPTGPHDAITDVPGVRVGHATVWHDDRDSVARTGVTAIVPDGFGGMYARPMAAGVAVLNGAGELTGTIQIREWGVLETPITLVSTNNVGRAADAMVDLALAAGVRDVVIPVVGECDDSSLDDVAGRHLAREHVVAAFESAAGGPVAEGVVGAGTGMITMGHKGGIGTASRVIDGLGTVGVLLLCNFGSARQLRIGGRPIGPALLTDVPDLPGDPGGSCIGIVLTDVPLDARQCERVARRVGLGLARVGSVAHHGSGDVFLAASTTNRSRQGETGVVDRRLLADGSLEPVFTAVVDAAEEAVVNALFVADTVTGAGGFVAPGLPVARVIDLLR